MAINIIAGSYVVFGFTEALFGARATRATLRAHAQRVAQIFHGFGAVTYSGMNMPFGNRSANTDIHG
jgi:hypothetical protein